MKIVFQTLRSVTQGVLPDQWSDWAGGPPPRGQLCSIRVSMTMMTMKNFNRRSSHGHHGSKRRELAQHAHSRGSHSLTHFISTQLQPRGTRRQLSYLFFRACWVFSCNHNPPRTLTWTTASLTCVRNHSCACVYTQRVGHSDESAQHLSFGKTLTILFLCS